MLSHLSLGLVDQLNITSPWWINTIGKKVVTRVDLAIYLESDIVSFSLQELCNQGRPVKHIDVIVVTRESKEGVPYPQALVGYGLKYNIAILLLVLELPLPRNRAIPPCPMHAIRLPNILGNPLALLMAIYRSMSSRVGCFKYVD